MKKILLLIPVFVLLSALFVLNTPPETESVTEETAVAVVDSCSAKEKHVVLIENEVFVPSIVNAKYCDLLVFENKDARDYLLAFGEHDKHIPYGNFREEVVPASGSVEIELLYTGSYRFHDHNNDEMNGMLSVE